MPITKEDLENRFKHHPPANGSPKPSRYGRVRDNLLESAEILVELTPECREQSIAITKLEEAMFWANAAIARTDPES